MRVTLMYPRHTLLSKVHD